MRITDLLDKRSIAFDKNPANKQETLDMAVDLMCASGKINDTEAYTKLIIHIAALRLLASSEGADRKQ